MHSILEHSLIITYQEIFIILIVILSLIVDAVAIGMMIERKRNRR